MTKDKPQNPDDSNAPIDQDADLVAFLRQHAPPVPKATAGEEDRLMMAIAAHQESARHQASAPIAARGRISRDGDRSKLQRIGIGVGCSILVYALWQLYQGIMPTHRSAGELAEIENFWFQNWDGVANAEEAPPWLAESDSGSDRPEHPLTPKHFYPSPARQE
jgi:hypothetical protein